MALRERLRLSSEGKSKDECHPWHGGLDNKGYGNTGVGGGHRYAWKQLVGPIPDDMEVDHVCHWEDETCPGGPSCQHRRCVNIAHLRLASKAENLAKRVSVDRPECINGHSRAEFSYRNDKGHWQCRRCKLDACQKTRRWQAAARKSRDDAVNPVVGCRGGGEGDLHVVRVRRYGPRQRNITL